MSNIGTAEPPERLFVDQPELTPQELADRVDDAEAMYFDWNSWALDKQRPPEGDWTTWLLLGGRGSGKTRAGAEWVRSLAAQNIGPIALVGETMGERGQCAAGVEPARDGQGESTLQRLRAGDREFESAFQEG